MTRQDQRHKRMNQNRRVKQVRNSNDKRVVRHEVCVFIKRASVVALKKL